MFNNMPTLVTSSSATQTPRDKYNGHYTLQHPTARTGLAALMSLTTATFTSFQYSGGVTHPHNTAKNKGIAIQSSYSIPFLSAQCSVFNTLIMVKGSHNRHNSFTHWWLLMRQFFLCYKCKNHSKLFTQLLIKSLKTI